MSKRLQVIMDDGEYAEIAKHAKNCHQTTAEWVRIALREARQKANRPDPSEKMRAIQVAAGYSFPTGEIQQILDEIQSGYSAELP